MDRFYSRTCGSSLGLVRIIWNVAWRHQYWGPQGVWRSLSYYVGIRCQTSIRTPWDLRIVYRPYRFAAGVRSSMGHVLVILILSIMCYLPDLFFASDQFKHLECLTWIVLKNFAAWCFRLHESGTFVIHLVVQRLADSVDQWYLLILFFIRRSLVSFFLLLVHLGWLLGLLTVWCFLGIVSPQTLVMVLSSGASGVVRCLLLLQSYCRSRW